MNYDKLFTINNDGFEGLSIAIVAQAIKDYDRAIKNKNDIVKSDIENFIHSEWFEMLTDLDGDVLLKEVRRINGR